MSGFASLLVDSGVQPADLEKAQAYQQKYGGRLEQILVNMGSLASEALPTIYSRLLSLEVLPSTSAGQWEPPENIDDFPLDFLVSRGWLPYRIEEGGRCCFATKAPLDLEVNDWLREHQPEFSLLLVSEETFGVLRARLGRFQTVSVDSSLNSVEEGRLRELASEAPTVMRISSAGS